MILENQKTINDVVNDVIETMSEQMDHLKQLRKEDLINEHFGFALWVRNLTNHWIPQHAEENRQAYFNYRGEP